MSRRRVYRDETIAVMERFFKALDAVIDAKIIRGIHTYCNDFGVDRRHLYAQRKDLGKGFFEIYWILPLIQHYGISSNWLLFGKGEMFKRRKSGLQTEKAK